jgi:hypothetical protein
MALDQLQQLTGYRVIPRVAPEIRIYYYLERFYGLPQPARFSHLGDAVRGSTKDTKNASLPAPPLPGLPPRVEAPTAAPTPAPALTNEPPARPERSERIQTSDPEEQEALELDAADLVEELEADDAELAPAAEKVEPAAQGDVASARTSEPASYSPISAEEAVEKIETTQQRSEVADAILSHASSLFDVATLLLVRDNMAFGWKGFGPHLTPDRIETMLLPLEVPSMFQVAVHNNHLYRARAFPNTLHNHWFKVLGTPVPNYSIVLICAIGNRAVNLFYGHRANGADIEDEELEAMQGVLASAAKAYVRLISASKAQRRAATLSPDFGMAEAATAVEADSE